MTTEEGFVKALQLRGIERAFARIGSAMVPISDLFPKTSIVATFAHSYSELFGDAPRIAILSFSAKGKVGMVGNEAQRHSDDIVRRG